MTNKFHAKKTIFDGEIYDSKKEAQYVMFLKSEKRKGNIINYTRQPRFDIIINGITVAFYKGDFEVIYKDHKEIWDVKGLKKGCAYQMFRLKKKLVEALYNIKIIEK